MSELVAFADLPHTDVLVDTSGPVLRYAAGEREGYPLADFAVVVDGRSVADASLAAQAAWRGWMVATPDHALASSLLAAGARARRHAHVMSAALSTGAAVDWATDLRGLTVASREATPLAPLYASWRRAYRPGHPDHEDGTDDEIIARCWTPYESDDWRAIEHRATAILLDSGAVAGGVVVSIRSGPPPFGGPWINDVWVDPAYAGRGLGAALLVRTQQEVATDGFSTVGLAVTEGNPARHVYERCGFREALESWTLLLPG